MQDACHINFVIDLAHRGVSVAQRLEYRSAECEDLRFDSSWGLRTFSLSHARDKPKISFSVCQVFTHSTSESEGLRFDSSWGIRIFSLSHARDKTKTSFSVYQLHFLLQRYYLVGLAVVSYPVSRDVSYATSDVCSHARG